MDYFLVCSIPLRQISKNRRDVFFVSSDCFEPSSHPYSAAERKRKDSGGGAEQAQLRLPEDPDHLDSELKVI